LREVCGASAEMLLEAIQELDSHGISR